MTEIKLIKFFTLVSAAVIAVMFIALGIYGIDFASVFFGTPWRSPLKLGPTVLVWEGIIVTVTLVFGPIFLAGVALWVTTKEPKPPATEKKS